MYMVNISVKYGFLHMVDNEIGCEISFLPVSASFSPAVDFRDRVENVFGWNIITERASISDKIA